MGSSCSALFMLVGQINQFAIESIRIAQRVDDFRQFGDDID
jgi:hypothetical protein